MRCKTKALAQACRADRGGYYLAHRAAGDQGQHGVNSSTHGQHYVIKPGFFIGLAVDGLKDSRLEISIKDGPLPTDADLTEPDDVSLRVRPAGWRRYWFGRKLQITKHRLDKLPLNPNAVIRDPASNRHYGNQRR